MKIKKIPLILSILLIGTATTAYAYMINITNNSPCFILIEAESATYRGFSELVSPGKTRKLDFGASCPWFIRVSDFLGYPDKMPFAVEMHYGNKVSEQCSDKTLVVTANSNNFRKVTQLFVHTEPWATTAEHKQWSNDFSSPVTLEAAIENAKKSKLKILSQLGKQLEQQQTDKVHAKL